MASSIILVIVSAVGLYCGLHCIANKMGMDKLHNSKEYLIEARSLSKAIKSDVSIDTLDPTKRRRKISSIFSKPIKLNSCVMIEYGNNDYRYLDNLEEYGLDTIPSSIGIHAWKQRYGRDFRIQICKGYSTKFYIDRDRLSKIDKDLYDRLVEVEALNISCMSDYNQKSIDTLRELFKRIKFTGNSEIDKYIEIGRSLEYKFRM